MNHPSAEIAIVGLACRLPGEVDSPSSFWELLREGRDAVRDEPPRRFDAERYYHPDPAKGRLYTKAGGFLGEIERFDASFFGISPREAIDMDPQQRLALELAWEALEDAGIVPEALAGSNTGVFMGVSNHDYIERIRSYRGPHSAYCNSGSATSIVANRVSYTFDLRGPSLAIDTACSSSLVAVHEACEKLRSGEIRLALAGGIGVLLDPLVSTGFCLASMLSPSGRCRAFDARADGFVRAEGGGVVVLKRLDDALADGDRVHAVILATAVNSDGRTRGLALPSQQAQEELLARVLSRARVHSSELAYVEAHGTGTPVGDPIECAALGKVIGAARTEPCWLGSVKTNVGHLEAAAGIAGLIKVVLCLKHRALPPSLHYATPNPNIPFEELNLAVVTQNRSLKAGDRPLVMGVNSFGFGGTNAHAVLREHAEEATPPARASSERTSLLLLSAKGPEAVAELAGRYAGLLEGDRPPPIGALCRSAATRRSHHGSRLAVVASSCEQTAAELRAISRGERAPSSVQGRARPAPVRTAFVFSGNGSQWPGMARGLLLHDEGFRAEVEAVDAVLQPLLRWSVLDELAEGVEAQRLQRTEVAQPLLFALQVALVERLRKSGLSPDAVVGHSVGEVAAAYAAGALSLKAACHVIAERSAAQGRTAGLGKMAAVGLSAERAAAALSGYGERLAIAGVNSPRSITVAGDEEAIDDLGSRLELEGIFFRKLGLDYAFHTRVMDPIEARIRKRLSRLSPGPSRIPFVSTVTGSELPGERLDAQYWWENIRHPVRFADAIQSLGDSGIQAFVEIGPHPILRGYLSECLGAIASEAATVPTLSRGDDDPEAILAILARCYVTGCEIDFGALFLEPEPFVSLPTYPWQRVWLWHGPEPEPNAPKPRRHPLLGRRSRATDPVWTSQVDPGWPAYLADHVVQGATVFPAAGYVELALAAAQELGLTTAALQNLEIQRAMVFPNDAARQIEVLVSPEDGTFRIRSGSDLDGGAVTNAIGEFLPNPPSGEDRSPVSIASLRERLPSWISGADYYAHCRNRGLEYGPSFQGVIEVWYGASEALGRVAVPEEIVRQESGYLLHPVLLDACLQIASAVLSRNAPEKRASYLPVRIGRFRLLEIPAAAGHCHVRIRKLGPSGASADFSILDGHGRRLIEVERVEFRPLKRRGAQPSLYEWRPVLQVSSEGSLGAATDPDSLARHAPSPATKRRAEQHRRRYYARARDEFNQLATAYAERAVRSLAEGESPFKPRSLVERGVLAEAHRRFFDFLLAILAEDGVARISPSGWVLEPSAERSDPDESWRELVLRYPDWFPELQSLGRAGRFLPALLRGEEEALHLLFGGAWMDSAEHLFESGNLFRTCNAIAADVLREAVRSWPERKRLRILEIGSGTGGLTAWLLPELPAERTDYLFTDVTEVFVDRAREKFKSFPFVRYGILDVERDPVEQGLSEKSFDIVVAANVVHATPDLRVTLQNLRRAMSPSGLLLLVETHGERSIHLTMGTLKGWWLFSDRSLRADSPLLPPPAWEKLLMEEGFDRVALLPDVDGERPSHSVILARNPSVAASTECSEKVSSEPGTWLVFADPKDAEAVPVIDTVVKRLEGLGHRVIQVVPGDHFERAGEDRYLLPPVGTEGYVKLCDALREGGISCTDVLHLWGLASPSTLDGDALLEAQERRSLSVALLAQALSRTGLEALPRLWIVTAGALPTPDDSRPLHPEQAPVWGLVRTLASEEPRLACRLIDVDLVDGAERVAEELMGELSDPGSETEILLREGARYVGRLNRVELCAASETNRDRSHPEPPAFALGLPAPGRIGDLRLRAAERRPPGPGEVEVRVHAAGLNFHDVLEALGVLPSEHMEDGCFLGMELTGEVSALGSEVSDFHVGERVYGFAPHSFRSHVTTSTQTIWHTPEGIRHEEAATLPVVFLTAYYALHHLGRLEPGERVLIHAAAGGVGLAAIQVAQWRGAEIFATAGSPEKRDFLRRLGVEHVFDSRSLAFVDEIRETTRGEGVDVVLNSLAGQAIAQGLSILRPGGRFLELGKRDFHANTRLGLRPFENNISFFGIDLQQLMVEQRDLVSRLWTEIHDLIDKGVFRPLPHRVFPASRAADAFRHMQRAKHIGKVVLDFDEPAPRVSAPVEERLHLDPEASYLVTGGLEGFGLATAGWLAERGARHLVLVGRRGPATPGLEEALRTLRETGAEVRVAAADVADAAQVKTLIRSIQEEGRRLRGVIHAAMALHDVPLLQMTREQWEAVLRPKVLGAWNLHRETLQMPLDFFVLYSSAAAVYGNPGQASYVAANLFLESLAHHRRARGLPGLAVAWGPIEDVGFLARNPRLKSRAGERFGLLPMSSQGVLDLLDPLVASFACAVAAAHVDWMRLSRAVPRLATLPLLERVSANLDLGASGGTTDALDLRERLTSLSRQEAVDTVAQILARLSAEILRTSAEQVKVEVPLSDLGMDSLMVVELQTAIQAALGVDLPSLEMADAPGLRSLAVRIADSVASRTSDAPEDDGGAEPA